jgi:hypothetical protein
LLIDYDNWAMVTPSNPVEASLRIAVGAGIDALMNASPDIETMRVRIYGGWVEDARLTNRASEIASVFPVVSPFPFSNSDRRVVHGDIVLANELVSHPSFNLGDTYKRRVGPPRLRLSNAPVPDGCINDSLCPARILTQFTRNKGKSCPTRSCPVTSASAFVVHEQKMVDTMLACDLLELVTDVTICAIALLTSDVDLIPPLVQSGTKTDVPILLISNSKEWNEDLREKLSHIGVTCVGRIQEVEDES